MMRVIKMTKKLLIAFIVMFVALVGVIGFVLVDDYKKDTHQQTSVVEPTEEATVEPTVEPTVDPETDPRFTSTDSVLVFANKKHKLPDGYEPSDLVSLTVASAYGDVQMRQEAATAIENMFNAANAEGVYPVVTTAYRSEQFQSDLYNGYVERDGQEAADTYSSRPGYSDHQTGLAADISCESNSYNLNQEFENTTEGQWLAQHAHEYGFVMRYPNGKESVTGYTYEPWHFRYIGVEEATALYNSDPNMTMEEYYGVSGGDYAD